MTDGFEEWKRRRLSETTSFQSRLHRSMNPKWTIRRRRLIRSMSNFVWYLCFWTIVLMIGVWIGYLTVLLLGGFDAR